MSEFVERHRIEPGSRLFRVRIERADIELHHTRQVGRGPKQTIAAKSVAKAGLFGFMWL
jgi:hypothetical protein